MNPRRDEPDPFIEEPWELEIAALLADLPDVEPPPGFIAAAVDHRPLNGGRAALAAGVLCVAAVGLVGAIGWIGPRSIAPSLSQLSAQHRSVEAAAAAGALDVGTNSPLVDAIRAGSGDDTRVEAVPPGPELLDLPTDYEHQGDLVVDNLRQAVYAHGHDTVSVFAQEGQADFADMGAGELRRFGSVEGWVDEAEQVLVVEAGDYVVTIVGLDSQEMAAVLDDARPRPANRWRAFLGELTAQLGFPD